MCGGESSGGKGYEYGVEEVTGLLCFFFQAEDGIRDRDG